MKPTKSDEYAMIILEAIQEKINDSTIDSDELQEGDNATHFIHAVLNVAPTMIYERLSGEQLNMLEVNHQANTLCFQYMQMLPKEEG